MTWQLLCFLISVIGLYQAFHKIDKENFEEYKIKFDKYRKKVLIIFALSAVASLIIDAYNNHQDTVKAQKIQRSQELIDSLNVASKFFKGQMDTLRIENERANREYVDSIVNYHNYTTNLLAGYGYRVDTLNHTLKKLSDKVSAPARPLLTIWRTPSIVKAYDKEMAFSFDISALNADVHMSWYGYILFNLNYKEIVDSPFAYLGGNLNQTTIVPKETTQGLMVFLERDKRFTDTMIIALEFAYKDENAKPMKPLRKVYLITVSNKRVIEADNESFYQVSKLLKKHKIWTKFYDY